MGAGSILCRRLGYDGDVAKIVLPLWWEQHFQAWSPPKADPKRYSGQQRRERITKGISNASESERVRLILLQRPAYYTLVSGNAASPQRVRAAPDPGPTHLRCPNSGYSSVLARNLGGGASLAFSKAKRSNSSEGAAQLKFQRGSLQPTTCLAKGNHLGLQLQRATIAALATELHDLQDAAPCGPSILRHVAGLPDLWGSMWLVYLSYLIA